MGDKMDEVNKPESKRLFINNVDLYQGINLAKYLSNCVVGASLEEAEEEEEEDKSEASGPVVGSKGGCYQIIGTLKQKDAKKPDFVKEIIQYQTKEQLYEHLFECDVIVYDITEDADQIDEAVWAVSELHADIEKMDSSKVFILISSVLTWARSKPLDPDDPEIPFTEEDYRRRKPHPNYKDHISAEKTVIKMGKTNKNRLVTYVIAAGLTYGCGEGIFHFLFKAAWHNAAQLQCFGDGENVVPMIHIKDLAAIVQNIADGKPKVRYLVAVDDSKNTLQEIVKSVSQNLGTGQVQLVSKEEALLIKDMKQSDFDQLLVDLRMDAVFVKENMQVNWASEAGLVENMTQIIREYRLSRGLLPMRILILGPPASGKTTISELVSKHYRLHHIKLAAVLEDAVSELERRYRDEIDDDQSDDEENEDRQLAKRIHSVRDEARDRPDDIVLEDILDDHQVTRFMREKLMTIPCQNQGFVLDGYPKSFEQAKDTFCLDDGDESLAEEGKPMSRDPSLAPSHIFVLDALDDFLKDRVLNLPEIKLMQSYRNDSAFARLLTEYRELNQGDEFNKSALSVFADGEIIIEHIDLMADQTPGMTKSIAIIKEKIGAVKELDLTETEKFEHMCHQKSNELKKQTDEGAAHSRHLAELREQRKQTERSQILTYEKSVQEEIDLLTETSLPLRNYLMTFVLPTLIKGLAATCKARPTPDQCLDYLAEYLFKNNPQIGYEFPGPLPWHEDDLHPRVASSTPELMPPRVATVPELLSSLSSIISRPETAASSPAEK